VKILIALGVTALSAAGSPMGALAAETLSPLVVSAPPPGLDPSVIATTRQSLSADGIARTLSVVTPEDTLRYLPNLLVRQRHIGDTQSPVATRTSGVGASARSLIYVDGVLISALIGNNNTSASPKWGLMSPAAIARVDVLYGPFSAAYAGNAIGGVIAFTTAMPSGFESAVQLQGASQAFSQYGDNRTFGAGRFAADLGDRLGRFAFRLSYNHLDADAHPLAYVTAVVPGSPGAAGTPVSGAFTDANRNRQPIVVLGSAALEHQVQDNASGRATFDLSPDLTAAYSFGLFHNDDRSTVNAYLRDAGGAPVYAGAVNIGGLSYTLANTAFANNVYRLDELQLAQGLSLGSHAGGLWDFELVGTVFDYLHSRQRVPSGALPAAFGGGPGALTALDGTGWSTLDANATLRPTGLDGAHIITLGAHQDSFRLDNPRYALANWVSGSSGAVQARSAGRTRTQALWAQDVWTLTPRLKATLGARWEQWQATDGLNLSVSPALNVMQPTVAAAAWSPKAVLAYQPSPGWTLKASAALAYRFPTVTELYQAVSTGALLQTPDPNLKAERALSSELSVERVWPSGSLRLSLFDERIANALLSQTALLPSGVSAGFVQNVDRTHATGVEVVAVRRDVLVRGLDLSGWVTYVDARIDRDAGFPGAVGKALPQLPHWRGAAVATYSPTPTLDLTVAGRYSDRAFATIDNSDHYADTYQGFSGYFVVDLHVRYRISPRLTAGLGVDNLNGRSYFLFHPFPQRTLIADLRYSY
jgi:iron complex outermembrane receptor protein